MVAGISPECLAESGGDATLTREDTSLIPKATLLCRPNSHPFQDRVLQLDQPVKVGRSVARARPINNNAIFDCKVLSRNHALLWYENGKFFLQDTKSSNGTFVNNQRLSKGSEESPPREVCSGDILQFGVDVMENCQKVTHGCIISTLRLFLPDGKEAKASPTIVNTSAETSIPSHDIYQLNQYIQASLAREQIMENKLKTLSKLVGETEVASNSGWKALMDEDRLLTRVEILEGQLTTYGKNMNEDKLREETKRLMEEKEAYQRTAKDTLKKLVDEKLEALKELKKVEESFKNSEDELASLKLLYENGVEENRKLSAKITELQEMENKKEVSEEKTGKGETISNEDSEGAMDESIIENLPNGVSTDFMTDSLDGTKVEPSCDNENALDVNRMMDEIQKLTSLVDELQVSKVQDNKQIINLNLNLDECKNENLEILKELENTKQKLVDTENVVKEKLDETEKVPQPVSPLPDTPVKIISPVGQIESEPQSALQIEQQQQHLEKGNEEPNQNLPSKAEVESESAERVSLSEDTRDVSNVSLDVSNASIDVSNASIDVSNASLEKSASDVSLAEAEEKIAGLLKLKEKLVKVQAEKVQLKEDLASMEEEISTITSANRSITACAILPILVMLVAFVIAFLPSAATLFGTNEL